MIDLNVEPVSIGPVVWQMKAGVVNVNSTKLAKIGARVIYADALRLAILEVKYANLEVKRVEVTICKAVIDGLRSTIMKFKRKTHNPGWYLEIPLLRVARSKVRRSIPGFPIVTAVCWHMRADDLDGFRMSLGFHRK